MFLSVWLDTGICYNFSRYGHYKWYVHKCAFSISLVYYYKHILIVVLRGVIYSMKPTSPRPSEASQGENGTEQDQAASTTIKGEHDLSPPLEALHSITTLPHKISIDRRKALLLVLLFTVLIGTIHTGAMQFIGPQGWGSTLGLPATGQGALAPP